MKTRIAALASMLVLGLLASATFGGEAGDYAPSSNGVQPEPGVVLKTQSDCPAGTAFFKNAFPSLTNGSGSGAKIETYSIGSFSVGVTVTWDANNAAAIDIANGVAHKVGVTVDTNNLQYDYTTATSGPVAADALLNKLADNSVAADINHLDLCLEALDTLPPEITIVSPADGETLSGTVTVQATVNDNVGTGTVTASVNAVSLGTPVFTAPDLYEWSWDTTSVPNGDYTIAVTATDSSANTATVSVVVTAVTPLDDCLEGPDGVPQGAPSADGCNITGYLQLEYAEELRDRFETFVVRQAAIPAKGTVLPSASCRTDLFPLVAQDPRVDSNGNLAGPSYELDLATLFDIDGHYARYHPGMPVPEAILRADTVGSPCLALIHQDAPDFADLTDVLPNGGVYTVTQFPENVPGMYEYLDRITAPLNYCDPAAADCDTLPACFDDPAVKCAQPDPQFVEQAAIQPDDRFYLVTPFASPLTYDVFNASRTKGFDGTFFPLNTREVCLALDPALVPGTAGYFDAVYQCKIDLALAYAEDTRLAVEEADARGNLLSPSKNTLLRWLNNVLGQIRNEHFERCVSYTQSLENDIAGGRWIVDERNDPGRLITYTRNLNWRCQQLLLDEAH